MSCEWESRSLTFIVEKRGEKKFAFFTMRGPCMKRNALKTWVNISLVSRGYLFLAVYNGMVK